MPKLAPGLYDLLVNREIADALADIQPELREIVDLGADLGHDAISRAVHARLVQALRSIGGEHRLERQVALANSVLGILERTPEAGTEVGDLLPVPPARLLAILEPVAPPRKPRAPQRPTIPLSSSDLLVNARHDLSLGPELRREIASADRIELLCSFVKWSGLRIVEDALAGHLSRRPESVRVLTTTYMGATERRALDRLVEMGAQVRVSYDRARTRLHAKAWLFHRDTGFSTAFIGSSNLSAAAVLEGLEWNVRLAQSDNEAILDKFAAAFDAYWADGDFRPYDALEFTRAVREAQREKAAPYLRFDLQPKPHQRRILEELAAERAYGHSRNLVVAATGTGKTVVAALDYERLRGELGRDHLLFVAHRREILQQSRDTFRVALKDGAFGELLGDGQQPEEWTHVFANIQSLTPARLAEIPADAFDVVIVDEFHHAAATSYERLLEHVRPRVLLGLTATPERADGQSILHWFDGRIASETRLWEALDHSLLCPFQYFGIGGAPDLRGVRWSRGAYDRSALSNVFTADHLFALRVLQETRAKVHDITRMRALGFCVDLDHARFMTTKFNEHGVHARLLSGESRSTERDAALRALRTQEIQIIFTVDLFNEGVDVPEVDTILFLRPTESATVFLQQLGRGLRLSKDKECCTVLDFIGHAHRRFRFDARYRGVVGGTRRELERRITADFPSLPAGCFMHLDEQARDAVLDNVRNALGSGRVALIDDLRAQARDEDPSLRTFLERTGTELDDIYASQWCWTVLRRKAGLEPNPPEGGDTVVERSFSRLLHLDDDRIERFEALLTAEQPPPPEPNDPYQRMLFVLIGNMRRPYDDMGAAWAHLWRRHCLRDELIQLLAILRDGRRHLTRALPGRLSELPLRVHGTYARDEVFAAFDERTSRNGVKRTQGGIYNVSGWSTELIFVELEKSEKDYSPTTLYNDYPITQYRFRWESQSSAHEGTPAGRRYLAATPGSDQHILLFVRQRRKGASGETMPYLCLGICDLAGHRGARPMRIDWQLHVPMPAWFFEETKIVGG
jgi:superfamily II DNA or RNA helicase/HKD family nuclease